MDEALRAKLLANTALAGLVASISWDERPEGGRLPAVILTMVTPGRDYTHDGWDGLNDTLIQVDIWALDPDAARTIALAMPAAIEPETIHEGWVIGPSFLESEDSGRESLDGGREGLNGDDVFRRRQDWRISNRPVA